MIFSGAKNKVLPTSEFAELARGLDEAESVDSTNISTEDGKPSESNCLAFASVVTLQMFFVVALSFLFGLIIFSARIPLQINSYGVLFPGQFN